MRTAAITIDIEADWGGRADASSYCQGFMEGLPKIIKILKSYNSSATFFVSTSLIEKNPDMLYQITNEGYEIASHGHLHNLDYSGISEKELLYQLQKSKDILEKIINKQIYGFRTPQFRMHPKLFKNLKTAGYLYDSSVLLGSLWKRYKFNKKYLEDKSINNIKEISVCTIRYLPIPFGLLWINALIGCWSKVYYCNTINESIVFYCHPFDFIVNKKKIKELSLITKSWYNWHSLEVENTFEAIIRFLKNNYELNTMYDISKEM